MSSCINYAVVTGKDIDKISTFYGDKTLYNIYFRSISGGANGVRRPKKLSEYNSINVGDTVIVGASENVIKKKEVLR
jgi:hypothetical protein